MTSIETPPTEPRVPSPNSSENVKSKWHREGSTVFTLKPNDSPVAGHAPQKMVNDNWFLVQGPNAESVASQIHAALIAAPADALDIGAAA